MSFRSLIAITCALITLIILCMSISSDNSDAGSCGPNTDYSLNDHTLTITGTGATYDYDDNNKAGWSDQLIYNVVVEDGVTRIGNNAFKDKWCIYTVSIADTVTEIGDQAFSGCSCLTELDLPSVTKIGQGAFNGCTSLKTVSLPISTDAVVKNGSPAFGGCQSIETITFTVGNGVAFAYSDDASSDAYFGKAPWQTSKDKVTSIRFADGITSVDQNAFSGFGFLDTDGTSPLTPGVSMSGYWFEGTYDAMVKLAHGVTVRLVDSGGKKIADNINEDITVGSDYSITMPHITGYKPSKDTVSGTLAQLSEVYTVTYSVGTYDLTITYKDTSGKQVADTHTSQVKFGNTYSVDSPSITGYTPDIATVSGTMDAEGKSIDVTYSGQDCTLHVSYYKNGGYPYQEKDFTYKMGEAYHIEIEHITGYVTDSDHLDGTMTKTYQYDEVRYNPGTYELTIVHRDKETLESLRDNVVQNVKYGESINYNVPAITGYTEPAGWVQITMDDEGKTYNLDYSRETVVITIRYVDSNNQDVAIPYIGTLAYGSDYSVDSPIVKGYTPDQSTVKGTALKNDLIKVTYTASSDGSVQDDDGQENRDITIGILIAVIVGMSALTIAAFRKW